MSGRSLIALVLLAAAAGPLAGCAGTVRGDCAELAGKGWTEVAGTPAGGAALLQQLNIPNDSEVVWFKQGDDRLLVCDHGFGLVNPACGGSTGYQYERVDGQWKSRGVVLPVCKKAPT